MDYVQAKQFLDTLPDSERGRPHPGPFEDNLPRTRALLRRLGDPQAEFKTVIVGGTNGKGTVSSLLAKFATGAGHRAGLYTSPHLHTIRERIQLNGEILSKDRWARTIGELFDRTRDFQAEGLGLYSRFEALTALAALLFAKSGVEYGIFEVGLGGTYDATNAWDSDLAVLTSIGLDHTDVLGTDLVGIAADKLAISRPEQPVFTTANQRPEVLARIRSHCESINSPLFVIDPAADRSMPQSDRQWRLDAELTEEIICGRPRTFVENVHLSLGAGGFLFGDQLAAREAGKIATSHTWPGRFERAGDEPCIVLDGAHNQPSAVALVEDLGALSNSWDFIVGMIDGHDATAVLEALRPLARRVILTSSDHSRSLSPTALQATIPDIPASIYTSCQQAFREVFSEAAADDHLCVTGSLALVARAREYLKLDFQHEGISEDVALESLACIEEACRRLNLESERVSDNGNVLRTTVTGRPVYFLRNKHPFNDVVAARLAEDKGYQYELLSRAGVRMPFSLQVFNPYADDRFSRYKRHRSIEEMVAEIGASMEYPVLIKKYRSSGSEGVYLERHAEAAAARLQVLFESSGFLDNTVLIQRFVSGREFRALASRGDLLLAYEKRSDREEPGEDLNPLHESTGRAEKVEDPQLLSQMSELVGKIAGVIDLGFYAVDLIASTEGLTVLELNPNPFCYFYNRSNGREDFIKIYQLLIRKFFKN